MKQTILIAAAVMLVLSAVLFAAAPVHAQGASECPGVSGAAGSEYGSGVSGVAPHFLDTAPYNPLNGTNNGCDFVPGPQAGP